MTDHSLIDPVGTGARRLAAPGPKKRRRQGRLAPYLLLSPALIIVLALFGLPLIVMFLLSFQDWSQVGQFTTTLQGRWTGLTNYSTELTSGVFWSTTVRTIVVSVLMVGGSMIIGLLFALLMRRIDRKSVV